MWFNPHASAKYQNQFHASQRKFKTGMVTYGKGNGLLLVVLLLLLFLALLLLLTLVFETLIVVVAATATFRHVFAGRCLLGESERSTFLARYGVFQYGPFGSRRHPKTRHHSKQKRLGALSGRRQVRGSTVRVCSCVFCFLCSTELTLSRLFFFFPETVSPVWVEKQCTALCTTTP
jgi:hypothetical protein